MFLRQFEATLKGRLFPAPSFPVPPRMAVWKLLILPRSKQTMVHKTTTSPKRCSSPSVIVVMAFPPNSGRRVSFRVKHQHASDALNSGGFPTPNKQGITTTAQDPNYTQECHATAHQPGMACCLSTFFSTTCAHKIAQVRDAIGRQDGTKTPEAFQRDNTV